jgi:hypothetical protein
MNQIVYFAEPLPGGRAQLHVDVVIDSQVVVSHRVGSPAPLETVRKHARVIEL